MNYGTADLAIAAVESLLAHDTGGRDLSVHLVDNASPSGDASELAKAHGGRGWGDRVTFWPEKVNHGFGRGNNVVLRPLSADPPDAVLLLNPDARLDSDVVSILAQALDDRPDAGAAGAAVLRPDGSRATAAFRFPSLASEVSRIAGFGPLDRVLRDRLVHLPPDHPGGEVDWVTGAAVMFRWEALAAVDFFDPGFFLYYEEVDMMRRMREAGWSVLHVPAARVVHAEGAATGQFAGAASRKRDPAYLYQSWRHYFVRAKGRAGALAIALLHWPLAAFNILHRRLRGKQPGVPLHFFRDHWRHVLWPLLSGRDA